MEILLKYFPPKSAFFIHFKIFLIFSLSKSICHSLREQIKISQSSLYMVVKATF